ncbi:MAG: aldo/keto reductase [Terracidiphilus sp.]
MQVRKLGGTDIEISPMAWGMWRFRGDDLSAAQSRVEAALDAGITLFDTADIYGPDNGEPFGAAEALLGRVFRQAPSLRRRMVLATKGGIRMGVPYDSSEAYLRAAIDASLTRLGTERVELWQVHRPDILTHPQEVARTLETAHQAGKIAAIGVSNFTVAQTAALAHFLTVPLTSHQPQFSPLFLEPALDGLLDQAMLMELTVLAWSPLGGGRLGHPNDERSRAVAALLDAKASETGVDRAAAAYSWIMAHPARPIPIAGTQNIERIAAIPQAFKVEWIRQEWYRVFETSLGEKLP